MKPRDTRQPDSRRRDLPGLRLITACLIIVLSSVAGRLASAQDSFPGLPLDSVQFKMSHNSYQQTEDIDDQLDNYNVWAVELDLNWEEDCGPCIEVEHCCYACSGTQYLSDSIAEILRSTDINYRVTFIWLEIKKIFCHETWPSNRRDIIRDTLIGLLGEDNIYKKEEFQRYFENNGHWPSWQEIRDQGKKFILVLEDPVDASGKADDRVLFITVASEQETHDVPWATFVNIKGADTSLGVPVPNDRWIYRAWFSDGTSDHHNWENGVSRGFNLIYTDDINGDYTILDSRTHSPQPLYVDASYTDPCSPIPILLCERYFGTKGYPMNDLLAATTRATPGSTLRSRPGNYAGSYTFAKPMIVEKDPRDAGTVVIGSQ